MSNPAETYERFMVPPLFAPFATQLVDIAGPRADDRVLDVGTGTGVVAREMAARVGSSGTVTGIDLNPDMLAVARAESAARNQSIDWHEGRAESLPFVDGSFTLALSQFSLMFFADRPAALSEMRRVLANDGRAAVSVWQGFDVHPFYQTLHDVIGEHLGTSRLGDIFALVDADELAGLLTEAGFRDVRVTPVSLTARFPNPDGFLAGEIDVDTAAIPAMQCLDAEERRDLVETIRADMSVPLRAVTEGDVVAMPFHAHIAHAVC
jgi:SAM-dependent methyltransferase